MTDEAATNRNEVLALTVEIVSAYAGNNDIDPAAIPELISTVFAKMNQLATDEAPVPETLNPAVPIKRSVTDDYIVCLEDGKKLKMLKRHLFTSYGMTPEEYRARWGLRADYPMVAPSYAAKRKELALKIGLGRKARVQEPEPAPAPAAPAKPRRAKKEVAA